MLDIQLSNVLATCRNLLRPLTDSSTPLLPFIPKSIKILLFLLFLVNSSSFPFSWHIRVWYTPLVAYYKVWTKGRKQYLLDWKAANEAEGGLLGIRTRTKRIATLDDCDYNMHLSNSCYAKNGDAARMELAIKTMSPVFTPGVHMAMGASHYVFFKEIPMLSEYVMEARTGGWGDKWFYVVTEYIIYPKKSPRSAKSSKPKSISEKAAQAIPTPSPPSETEHEHIVPTITAVPGPSRSDTPDPANKAEAQTSTDKEGAADLLKKATYRARQPREDGGVVCSIAVNEYCFKMGRVTVPPRIAFHLALQSTNPDEIDHALSIINSKDKGKAWVKGGWKNEPNADTLGLNIAGMDVKDEDGEVWFEKGRKGMERVVEGLSVF